MFFLCTRSSRQNRSFGWCLPKNVFLVSWLLSFKCWRQLFLCISLPNKKNALFFMSTEVLRHNKPRFFSLFTFEPEKTAFCACVRCEGRGAICLTLIAFVAIKHTPFPDPAHTSTTMDDMGTLPLITRVPFATIFPFDAGFHVVSDGVSGATDISLLRLSWLKEKAG